MGCFSDKYFSLEEMQKIKSVKIGVAGCGGLGSNCAMNLVRSGFINFTIVDFDKVEESNLNRQFFFLDQVSMNKVDALEANLKRINSNIKIEKINKKIDENNVEEIFDGCDIIVEAFDKAEYKKILVEKLLQKKKLIVCGSGLAGYGFTDDIKTHKIKDNLFIIGDLDSETCTFMQPVSPRVNIVSAKQADVILNYVINEMV